MHRKKAAELKLKGMGNRSVVYGHIHTLDNESRAANAKAIARFTFDEYIFRNIFLQEESVKYKAPSIFIGGTFKQIEERWGVWFNRFAQFLSTLEAVEANVTFDCYFGRFAWILQPRPVALEIGISAVESLVGEEWFITSAPSNEVDLNWPSTNVTELCNVKRVIKQGVQVHN